MEDSIKDLVKEINVLNIKKDQALVLKIDMNVSLDMLENLRGTLQEYLGCKVLIVGSDVELEVLDIDENNEHQANWKSPDVFIL